MYKDPEDKIQRLGVPYGNQPDYPIKKTVCLKDADGNVRTRPPQMLHHPLRGGHYNSTYGHTINKFPKYEPDVYDIGRHAEYVERKKWTDYWKEKGYGYFRSMNAGPYVLNKDKNVYGNRPPLGPTKKAWKYKGVQHENNWRPNNPNKKGKMGTLDVFKRLIPDPSAIHKAVRKPEDPNKKDAFKPSRNYLTKPSPSVSLNRMNIRSMIRSAK